MRILKITLFTFVLFYALRTVLPIQLWDGVQFVSRDNNVCGCLVDNSGEISVDLCEDLTDPVTITVPKC